MPRTNSSELIRRALSLLLLPLLALAGVELDSPRASIAKAPVPVERELDGVIAPPVLSRTADTHRAVPGATVAESPLPVASEVDTTRRRIAYSPASCGLPANPGPPNSSAKRVAFRAPHTADELSVNVQCLLNGSVRGGRWGIMIVSLSRGDTLYESDAGTSLLPASTQKLFTAALALDQLGPEHQFHTTVLRSGEVDSEGVLRGDLVLQGGGDPAFTSWESSESARAPMEILAELVRGSGVKAVTGDLVADPSAFDSRLVPDGWLNRYLNAPYAARVSALSLNSNVASVVIAPGEGDESAPVVLDPPALTVNVQSAVRTIPGSRGSSISLRTLPDQTIQARGWIGSRSNPARLPLVVEDPASFTAGAFRSALVESGVKIGGLTRVAPKPEGTRHLTDLPSPPLSELITSMNRESINHYAELIFRNSGRGVDGLIAGSADAGFMRLDDFLSTKVGTDPGSVYAVDGSGLSVLNRVTPRALIHLLSHAHRAPWGPVFHASLPVAGESATLRDRMRNTAAQGNLHAKTGTTSAVVALSGYVTAENGEILAFAFLYNGPDGGNARTTIDYLGPALVALSRK